MSLDQGCNNRAIMLPDLSTLKTTHLFLIISFFAIIITWLGNDVLLTEDLVFQYFGDQLSYERASTFIEKNKKWQWVAYVLIPLFYLLKFFLIAGSLSVGILIENYKIPFKKIIRFVILCEFIFIVIPIIKIFWFGIFFIDYSLLDLQYFSPLSLLSFIDRDSIEPWFAYPLQLINLFEVAYWLLLAYGLYKITGERYARMFELVASSYGIGLLLWTIFIVFLTVNAGG